MDKAIEELHSLVNEIVGFARGPGQSLEIRELERGLMKLAMKAGREGLLVYLAEKGTGYQENEIVTPAGQRLPYVRDRKCRYRSIFGPVDVNRSYYHQTGIPGTFPLDHELNLPDRGYSYLLQEVASKLAVNGSYEKSGEIMSDILFLDLRVRSLERIVGDTYEDVAGYYDQKPTPDSSEQAVVTVATIDRKGVVIRKPPHDGPVASTVPTDPDKPGKKK